jgi:hypothetical protein
MHPCRNHPHLPATRSCAHCHQPFCDACTVDFLGQPHCGPCRDMRLQWMQPANQAQKNPHHQLRENLLVAAAIMIGVAGFLLNAGLMVPAAVFGGLIVLTLIGALVVHMTGSK